MPTWFVLATVCIAVLFYVRFLVAICRECWRAKICYLARIEPAGNEIPVIEAKRVRAETARAA
jgi:hypothetical protein